MRTQDEHDVHDCFVVNFHDEEAVGCQLFNIFQFVQLVEVFSKFESLRFIGIFGNKSSPFYFSSLFSFVSFSANQVDKSLAFETSSNYLHLRDDPDFEIVVGEVLAGDHISSKEIIAFFRSSLVDFLRDEFPERLETRLFINGFLEVVLISFERRGDASFVFGVFEVDNIMRFYFVLLIEFFTSAMLNKFPKAFPFVLIDD